MFNSGKIRGTLENLVLSEQEDESTISWNLLHDSRISDARYEAFAKMADQLEEEIACGPSLREAVSHYHQKRVREEATPDFSMAALNALNFHNCGEADTLHPDLELVSILNLNKLVDIYDHGTRSVNPRFREVCNYGIKKDGESGLFQIGPWLDSKLDILEKNPYEPADQNPFLRVLLEIKNDYQSKHPFEPTWATLWKDFLKRKALAEPVQWQNLVGVRPSASSTWLLLLKYPVHAVRHVIRPTQLDSGWYPEHFPSPPRAGHGYAMHLKPPSGLRSAMPEYIHCEIKHTPAHIVACKKIPGSVADKLRIPQQKHWKILERAYDVKAWEEVVHPCNRVTA